MADSDESEIDDDEFLNNKLKKKIGLRSSASCIFFSPGIVVNGAHSGGESSRTVMNQKLMMMNLLKYSKIRMTRTNLNALDLKT
jgi:hypothetical protein